MWELQLPSEQVTQDDVNAVNWHWIFPIATLDMSEQKADLATLQETRQAILDRMAADLQRGGPVRGVLPGSVR